MSITADLMVLLQELVCHTQSIAYAIAEKVGVL